MKVLIAIDTSDTSEAVISEVAGRPWPEATEMHVLTVLDLFVLPSGLSGSGPVEEADADAARALVTAAADRLTSAGNKVTTAIVEGYPPTSIIEHADHWGADFIVVGSQGQSGITRFLLGSVALDVVRRAPCSVEIVRPSGKSEEGLPTSGLKIILGTDGSASSVEAARSVAERPWPEGSEVRVVCAVQTNVRTKRTESAPEVEYIGGAALTEAEQEVEASMKLLADAGLKTAGAVLVGSPKERIIDEAKSWGANLIVVGSHGRRGFMRLFMGSVSEAVAMHAHCSVEIIRRRELETR